MPIVKVPAPMKFYVDNQSEFEAKGATVAELLENILLQYPAFKPHLYDSKGNLRRYFSIFVNGTHVRDLNGMDTTLKDDDRVILMASAAGGNIDIDKIGKIRKITDI
ncbi:MAG: MoaD/ThiS family protein [Anaerolineales bacterium]|jgi:molybdopterin converting factor small subunit|nr:MoaD/ThiS family protein [Anaerolineales bacterium]